MKERKGREEKSEGESKVKEGEGEKKRSISAWLAQCLVMQGSWVRPSIDPKIFLPFATLVK